MFKKKENKNYKWELLFKNDTKTSGTCKASNLDEIHDMFFKDSYFQHSNGTKAEYYNTNEILIFHVEEIKEE